MDARLTHINLQVCTCGNSVQSQKERWQAQGYRAVSQGMDAGFLPQ